MRKPCVDCITLYVNSLVYRKLKAVWNQGTMCLLVLKLLSLGHIWCPSAGLDLTFYQHRKNYFLWLIATDHHQGNQSFLWCAWVLHVFMHCVRAITSVWLIWSSLVLSLSTVGIQRMEPRELHDMRRGLCIGIYNYEYKIIEINCHADPYCP